MVILGGQAFQRDETTVGNDPGGGGMEHGGKEMDSGRCAGPPAAGRVV